MAAKTRAVQRAERIRELIPIVQVLADYGYDVRADGGDREQQFPCNLHGDGYDLKPSARVYPESQSWYCFACDLPRDAIATVRANEGLSFWDAVRKLERAYNLPVLPWEDEEDEPSTQAVVEANQQPDKTFEDEAARFESFLLEWSQERLISLETALSYWEAFDKIVWHVQGPRGAGGPWTPSTGQLVLGQLRARLLEEL